MRSCQLRPARRRNLPIGCLAVSDGDAGRISRPAWAHKSGVQVNPGFEIVRQQRTCLLRPRFWDLINAPATDRRSALVISRSITDAITPLSERPLLSFVSF